MKKGRIVELRNRSDVEIGSPRHPVLAGLREYGLHLLGASQSAIIERELGQPDQVVGERDVVCWAASRVQELEPNGRADREIALIE